MTISKFTEHGKTVFKLTGRLDTKTAPELQNALIPEFDVTPEVEIDFSELAYISSAGLRVILAAQKTSKSKSGAFSVSNVSAEIMEVMEMTGFTSFLTIK